MEIELGPTPKYENVRSNAYWTRVHLDTTMWPDIEDAKVYKAHLQDCIDNPTIGLLARKKYITRKPFAYPDYAWRNKTIMENSRQIKEAKSYLNSIINIFYPKTKFIREYIIDKERVVLDEVKRARKYTNLDKIMILLKKYK